MDAQGIVLAEEMAQTDRIEVAVIPGQIDHGIAVPSQSRADGRAACFIEAIPPGSTGAEHNSAAIRGIVIPEGEDIFHGPAVRQTGRGIVVYPVIVVIEAEGDQGIFYGFYIGFHGDGGFCGRDSACVGSKLVCRAYIEIVHIKVDGITL